MNWPDGHQAGDTQGLGREVGLGQRRSWREGAQIARWHHLPQEGECRPSTGGSDTSCTEDVGPSLAGTPGGRSAESPSPSPLCPAVPWWGGLGEGQ